MASLLAYGILLWSFCIILQLLFWLLSLPPILGAWSAPKPSTEGVSLVICTHNDLAALQQHLPFWLSQKYPAWELILIDDHSTDTTWSFLAGLAAQQNIRFYSAAKEGVEKGKKSAQAFGIRQARYDWILVTDADCRPLTPLWIKTMMEARQADGEMVLGVGLLGRRTGILNQFIRFEMTLTAIQYLSAAYWKTPYMGVGRNLLFAKTLYQKTAKRQGGHLAYGDDDLFVNAVRHASITACLDPASFTESPAKQSWKDYLQQKTRHVSTGKYYQWWHQLLLAAWAFSHFLFWLGLVAILLVHPMVGIILGGLRLAMAWFIYNQWAKHLQNGDLRYGFPAWDLLLFIYYLCLSPYIFWKDKKHW